VIPGPRATAWKRACR